jgi:hypothetical protein
LSSATFTNDELILVLISLVRATHPRMLRSDGDGFTVDFEPLAAKKKLTPDERLLLKMRALMEGPPGQPTREQPPAQQMPVVLELDEGEAQRLAAALGLLEVLQQWPADVLEMSRSIRSRLAALP